MPNQIVVCLTLRLFVCSSLVLCVFFIVATGRDGRSHAIDLDLCLHGSDRASLPKKCRTPCRPGAFALEFGADGGVEFVGRGPDVAPKADASSPFHQPRTQRRVPCSGAGRAPPDLQPTYAPHRELGSMRKNPITRLFSRLVLSCINAISAALISAPFRSCRGFPQSSSMY